MTDFCSLKWTQLTTVCNVVSVRDGLGDFIPRSTVSKHRAIHYGGRLCVCVAWVVYCAMYADSESWNKITKTVSNRDYLQRCDVTNGWCFKQLYPKRSFKKLLSNT